MMKGELLTTAQAAVWGARLSKAEVAGSSNAAVLNELKNASGSHSWHVVKIDDPLSACSAAAYEKRSFVAVDTVEKISYRRIPLVAFSTNIHHDAVVISCASIQELLDTTIMSYKIAEDKHVLLPVVVTIDDMLIRESAIIPTRHSIEKFLPKYSLPYKLDKNDPIYLGYNEDKPQADLAFDNVCNIATKVDGTWQKKFRRSYGLYELFGDADAEISFVLAGTNAYTCMAAVASLRKEGEKVCMIRLRMLKPFPEIEFLAKKIAFVGDNKLKSNLKISGRICVHFIPEKHLAEADFISMFKKMKSAEKNETYYL